MSENFLIKTDDTSSYYHTISSYENEKNKKKKKDINFLKFDNISSMIKKKVQEIMKELVLFIESFGILLNLQN